MSHRVSGASRRVRIAFLNPLLILVVILSGCAAAPQAPSNLPRAFVAAPFQADSPKAYLVDPGSKYATFDAELKDHCGDLPEMNDRD